VVGVACPQWREGETAVSTEDACDAMERRRCRVAVPEQLCVVVRVHVDEAGGDNESRRVEGLLGLLTAEVSDLHDAAVQDGNVGGAGRGSDAVDDESADN